MSLKVLKSSAWKDIASAKVLKSSAWKTISNGWVLKSGAWKKFWPGGDFDLIAGNISGVGKGFADFTGVVGTATPYPPYLAGYRCLGASSTNTLALVGLSLYIPGITVDPGQTGWGFTNFLINDSGGSNLFTATAASASGYTFTSGYTAEWEWTSAFKFVVSSSYQIKTT